MESKLQPVIDLIPVAAKALEEMRSAGSIGSSFDAQINILTKDQERYTFLQSFRVELCEIFKVSQIEITLEKGNCEELSIKVGKASGTKCLRCWNYSLEVGKDQEHPLICDNCLLVVKGEVK